MRFYDRKEELEVLRRSKGLSLNRSGQLVVVVGRRRVGKSSLIKKFNKDGLYFFVSKKKSFNLLREFSKVLAERLGHDVVFEDWDTFIKEVFLYSINHKCPIIFDEFQNFKYIEDGILDTFQKYWDVYEDQKNLFIIIAGSVIKLLEDIFYEYKEPLYKRATKRIFLHEFRFPVVYKILKDNKREATLDLRGFIQYLTVFGGAPYYYSEIDKSDLFNDTLISTIAELVLAQGAVLQDEGREILIQEFGQEHPTYFAILESIALGKDTFTLIASHTNLDTGSLTTALQVLSNKFYLIRKQQPVFPNNQRITRYKITNNFIKFWFRYIYANQSIIRSGYYKNIVDKIESELNELSGRFFEEMCLDFILSKSNEGDFDFPVEEYGCWWDKKGDVDLLVGNKSLKKVFVGECKLDESKVTPQEIDKLKNTALRIDAIKKRDIEYAFFVAEKLSKEKRNLLKKNNVRFYDSLDLMKYFKSYKGL